MNVDYLNAELHELLLPYSRLEEAVSRWLCLHYLPTRHLDSDIDLDGCPLQMSSEDRAPRTKEAEEALAQAYMDLLSSRCELWERTIVRMFQSGKAADIDDLIKKIGIPRGA